MKALLLAALAAAVVAFYPHHGTRGASSLPVAERSVVKVTGIAECGLAAEGSGFVYAPGRVMTNAHVVAGMRGPQVVTKDGHQLRGRVVLYDPRRDVAVIDVPGMKAKPLDFDGTAGAGDRAVIAGYPEDGPFAASGAHVHAERRIRKPDIYQTAPVVQEVYVVRGRVRPGNSGGPLLSPEGKVYGVVSAVAADREDVGYVLTADEVARDARAGEHADRTVSTRSCERERP